MKAKLTTVLTIALYSFIVKVQEQDFGSVAVVNRTLIPADEQIMAFCI